MSTLRERIDAELENLESSILLLPSVSDLPYKTVLEQAGVAGVLHSFYNGIENILKQIVADRGLVLPNGPSWHRDLLALAAEQKFFPGAVIDDLKQYMAFRHYFAHAYVLDVYCRKNRLDLPKVVQASRLPIRKNRRDAYSTFAICHDRL